MILCPYYTIQMHIWYKTIMEIISMFYVVFDHPTLVKTISSGNDLLH